MKRFIVIILWIALLASGTAHGTVIQCDSAATGTAPYPNVACSSGGALQVAISGSSTGNTAVIGPTAASATITTAPVLVAGTDATLVRVLKTDSSGNLTISTASTLGISVRGSMGAVTDCSGTITTGGTVQSLIATNASRRYLLIQNQSVGALYINFTSNATVGGGSFEIAAGGSFVMENNFISTEAIAIIGATTGQVFTCKQA